ncbi:MAG: hypothetical protein CVU64_15640 [Deltaproteobacteria bacterium HGW-Deltaproteobacteria-21]|nr:MAG: hypothetical protein CVU64_15640 [Deltaproteobacteria bacterium HGW-Deltaproteobacteria-21]
MDFRECEADRRSDGLSDCIRKTTGFLPQCIQRVAGVEMTGAINFTFPGGPQSRASCGEKKNGRGRAPARKEIAT